MSISNFQSGTIDYATKHGIALIQIIEAGEQFCSRAKLGAIVSSPHIPFNYGRPYVGVLQYGMAGMTHCSYLSLGNMSLQNFLLNSFKEKT
jgi:restriction system protein